MSSASPDFNGLVQIGSGTEGRREQERALRWAGLHPTSALLYVENKCHMKCEHCYESEESHPHDQRLSLADYQRIFEELKSIGVLTLTFTGGEIFLRRDLLDLVALARKMRFAVKLYTSGTHIDEVKAERVAALKVQEVHISVYSHQAQTHDEFTGVLGSHARSTRALRLLRERGVATVLKSNVLTFNVDFLDELIALAHELGADWQLDPSVRSRMNGDDSPQRFGVSTDVMRRKVLARPDLAAHFRARSAEELCTGERSLVEGDAPLCGAGRATLAIAADGGVLACGFFPTAAGSLKQRSLAEIWYGSKQLDEVRRASFASQRDCPHCDVRSTCHPCMAQAAVETGDHTACNDTSRFLALSLRDLAERKTRANQKMQRGRPLPLIGDQAAPSLAPKGIRLNAEP